MGKPEKEIRLTWKYPKCEQLTDQMRYVWIHWTELLKIIEVNEMWNLLFINKLTSN